MIKYIFALILLISTVTASILVDEKWDSTRILEWNTTDRSSYSVQNGNMLLNVQTDNTKYIVSPYSISPTDNQTWKITFVYDGGEPYFTRTSDRLGGWGSGQFLEIHYNVVEGVNYYYRTTSGSMSEKVMTGVYANIGDIITFSQIKTGSKIFYSQVYVNNVLMWTGDYHINYLQNANTFDKFIQWYRDNPHGEVLKIINITITDTSVPSGNPIPTPTPTSDPTPEPTPVQTPTPPIPTKDITLKPGNNTFYVAYGFSVNITINGIKMVFYPIGTGNVSFVV